MKYLFIVTESESANGICTEAVMRDLSEKHEVFCLTNREYGASKQFEKNGIRFYTVRPRLVYRIASMASHGELSLFQSKVLKKIGFLVERCKQVLTLGSWPLLSRTYAKRIENEAWKICEEHGIQCIVPIYTQIDTLIAACNIKKKRDVFYIPYFLDSLSGGYGLRVFTPDQTRNRALAWERKLLYNADWIIAMESSRKHHQQYSISEHHYDRMLFFDLPLLRDSTPEISEPILSTGKCNLVYVGSLPSGIRSPEYILNVFRHLQGDEYQFWFVGTSDCAILNDAALQDQRIHVVGRCSHEIAMQYEAQADVLVNIGNTNPNMTPSKIFEYMSFGKPIISTMMVDAEPSRAYLEKYPQTMILDEREQSYEQAAHKIRNLIAQSKKEIINMDHVRSIFYQNTPKAMADFLEKIDRVQEK